MYGWDGLRIDVACSNLGDGLDIDIKNRMVDEIRDTILDIVRQAAGKKGKNVKLGKRPKIVGDLYHAEEKEIFLEDIMAALSTPGTVVERS